MIDVNSIQLDEHGRFTVVTDIEILDLVSGGDDSQNVGCPTVNQGCATNEGCAANAGC